MVAITGTVPARRSTRALGALAALGRRAAAHAHATARRLSGSVLTAAGLGCIDVGAFQADTVAGWVVTGLSVLLLDWAIE